MRTTSPASAVFAESSPISSPIRYRFFLILAIMATVITTAVTGGIGVLPAHADPVTNVDILSINDFHGRIEPNGGSAGAAVLSGAINEFRNANPNTLVVSAGDNIGASTFTSFIQEDKPTLDALNAIHLDASSVGNHEFDHGFADLSERVKNIAQFPYLAANVYDTKTGRPALPEYSVEKVDGVSVGFIGAVTEELPTLVSPAGLVGLEVRSVVTEVNRVANQLRDGDESNGEADVVVLLVHEGAESSDISTATDDSPFGTIVRDVNSQVNAIVSGHTHQAYSHTINGRPITQTGQYGERIGRLRLSVDRGSKKLVSLEGGVLPLTEGGKALYPSDPAIVPIVNDAVNYAQERGGLKVGEIAATFNRARQSNGSENRGGSSTMVNLVADTQLWATHDNGTEIAFMNPGGVRSDLLYESGDPNIPNGTVSYRSVAGVQPYANMLTTMTLTGAQVKSVLEEQWQPASASRSFLKLGISEGLTYIADPTASRDHHITSLSLNGQPVTDNKTYKVVVNGFLASGGDNFTTFLSGTHPADSGRADLQTMIDYFTAHHVVSPDLSRRSIGLHFTNSDSLRKSYGANGAPTYKPGATVTAELSSLLYTTHTTLNKKVTLNIGDTQLGSAEIDPSIVDSCDETGRATITFTLPENLIGTHQVTISIPGTSTSFTIPITIAG